MVNIFEEESLLESPPGLVEMGRPSVCQEGDGPQVQRGFERPMATAAAAGDRHRAVGERRPEVVVKGSGDAREPG